MHASEWHPRFSLDGERMATTEEECRQRLKARWSGDAARSARAHPLVSGMDMEELARPAAVRRFRPKAVPTGRRSTESRKRIVGREECRLRLPGTPSGARPATRSSSVASATLLECAPMAPPDLTQIEEALGVDAQPSWPVDARSSRAEHAIVACLARLLLRGRGRRTAASGHARSGSRLEAK